MGEIAHDLEQIYPISGTIQRKVFNHGIRNGVELIVAQSWTQESDGHVRPVDYVQVAREPWKGGDVETLLKVDVGLRRYAAHFTNLLPDGRETSNAAFTGYWVRRDQVRGLIEQ